MLRLLSTGFAQTFWVRVRPGETVKMQALVLYVRDGHRARTGAGKTGLPLSARYPTELRRELVQAPACQASGLRLGPPLQAFHEKCAEANAHAVGLTLVRPLVFTESADILDPCATVCAPILAPNKIWRASSHVLGMPACR